ncbi:MAG: AsmA-like C-terminal region-containing protein [Thermodesulfobacteriota bacterium]
MSKLGFKWILLIVFVLIICLAVFTILNLNGLVNSNKDLIIGKLENQLGRKIEVGEIGINIWGGLGLKLTDFKIEDDPEFSKDNMVEAGSLVVSLKFIPLLKKDFQIKKIILNDPVIRLIQNKEGKYNFSSLGEATKNKKAEDKSEKNAKLFIALVDITNGEIIYEDQRDKTRLQLSKIDFSSKEIKLSEPISFNLAMAVISDDQNIKLNGSIGPVGKAPGYEGLPVDLVVNIDSVDFADLKKNFPQINELIPPDLGLNGPLKAAFNARGKTSELNINNLDLNGAVFGSKSQNLNVKGNLGPVGKGVSPNFTKMDLDFSLDPVEFEKLKQFKPIGDALPPELNGNGPLKLSGNIKGTADNFKLSSVFLDATGSQIVYGDIFKKDINTTFTVNTNSTITKESVDLNDLQVELDKLVVDANGNIALSENKNFDLNIISKNADLASLSDNLIALKNYKLNGNLDLDLDIKGSSENPEIYGTAKFIDVGADSEGLPKPIAGLNGLINFNGSTADLKKTEFNIGNSKLYIDADMESFSPVTGSYDLSCPELYLSDLSKTAGKGEIFKDINISGKINANGSQTADISSSSGNVSKVHYKKLNGNATLKDGIINFNDFKFNFLDAKFKSSGTFDLSGDVPKFQMAANLTGVSVPELMKTFLNPVKYPVIGVSSINLVLKGAGKGWDSISKTLKGHGKLEVNEGGIENFNVADTVMSGITGIPGTTDFISNDMKEKHPAVFKNKDMKIHKLSTPINIDNGKVNLEDIALKTDGYDINGKGVIGLDGSMDMNGVVALSSDLSDDMVEQRDYIKYLKNNNGRVEIPFKLDESMKPQPDMDYLNSSLQQAAQDKTKDEVKKKILENLKPKEDQVENEQTQQPENTDLNEEDSNNKDKDSLDSLIEDGIDKVFNF